MAYPRFQTSRSFKTVIRRTGSNIVLNSATSVELAAATNGPGTGGFDLTLAAQVGDVIEYCPNFLVNADITYDARFDVATIVSSAVVSFFSSGTATMLTSGVGAWYSGVAVFQNVGPPFFYTIVSGDLSSGAVTLRPYYKQASAGTKTVLCSSTDAVQFTAKNLGPVDPT